MIFQGAATALITPMKGFAVDYDSFGRLIDWQIEQGIDALVICGTTGESSTLSDEEHRQVLEFAARRIAKRVPMIAGTGSNDAAYAIELTKFACDIGADASLVVTPYYNKATQNGLVQLFTAVADASTKPVILYNVPSRTGCNLLPETVAKLADHPRIAAVKEASGNITQVADIMALCGDKIDVYSGNDDQIVPILSLGGKGVISVLSNLLPQQTSRMCHAYLQGDVRESRQLQLQYLPLIHALFSEVNPIPVKAAMQAMGFCGGDIRLPLTPLEPAHAKELARCMREAGLL